MYFSIFIVTDSSMFVQTLILDAKRERVQPGTFIKLGV